MKCIISKADIVALISKVQGAIPSKPQMPILANILIRAVDNQLTLIASDLTISIMATMNAKIEEEGSVVLPPKKLFPLLKELTTPEIEIRSTGAQSATIKAGTSQFKVLGVNGENYPEIEDLLEGEQITLPVTLFKEMLMKTSFAAGHDETRPIFSSVLLERSGNTLTFTGTDGKRLAKAFADVSISEAWQGSFIIPHKTVEEMIHLLDPKEETLSLRFTGEKISMQSGSITLISQLMSGQYPDVSRIIPEKTNNAVELHREELMSLLRQIALFTGSESSSARFTFTPGQLHLSAASGEAGEGSVSMPANYQGEPLEIAFNPTYLLEILRHSKDETINLDVKNSYNPGLITDESTATFVLMPMRLDS
jgi:DNA polymerase-3 subunit beta